MARNLIRSQADPNVVAEDGRAGGGVWRFFPEGWENSPIASHGRPEPEEFECRTRRFWSSTMSS